MKWLLIILTIAFTVNSATAENIWRGNEFNFSLPPIYHNSKQLPKQIEIIVSHKANTIVSMSNGSNFHIFNPTFKGDYQTKYLINYRNFHKYNSSLGYIDIIQVILEKSIRITTDKLSTIQVRIIDENPSESFNVLPTKSLGNSYRIITKENYLKDELIYPDFIQITALENNSQVTIKLPDMSIENQKVKLQAEGMDNTSIYNTDNGISIKMKEGESICVMNTFPNSTINGATVECDKNIVVASGNWLSNNDDNEKLLIETMQPISNWGKYYNIVNFSNFPMEVKVIASEPDTKVYLDNNLLVELDGSSDKISEYSYITSVSKSSIFSSDKAIMVVEYPVAPIYNMLSMNRIEDYDTKISSLTSSMSRYLLCPIDKNSNIAVNLTYSYLKGTSLIENADIDLSLDGTFPDFTSSDSELKFKKYGLFKINSNKTIEVEGESIALYCSDENGIYRDFSYVDLQNGIANPNDTTKEEPLELIPSCVDSTYDELTVIYPNGGENFEKQDTVPIRWCGIPDDTKVNISYSSNGGTSWKEIAEDIIGNEFLWYNENSDSELYENLIKVDYVSGEVGKGSVIDSTVFNTLYFSEHKYFLSENGRYVYLFGKESVRIDIENNITQSFKLTSAVRQVLEGNHEDIVYFRTDNSIIRFNINELKIEKIYESFTFSFPLSSFNVSNDSKYLIIGDRNGNIILFDHDSGKELKTYYTREGIVTEIDINFDNSLILYTNVRGINTLSRYISLETGNPIENNFYGGYSKAYFLNNYNNDCFYTRKDIYYFDFEKDELKLVEHEQISKLDYNFYIRPYRNDSIILIEEFKNDPNSQLFTSVSLFDIKIGNKVIYENNVDTEDPFNNTPSAYDYTQFTDNSYIIASNDKFEVYDLKSKEIKFSFIFKLFEDGSRLPLKTSIDNEIVYFHSDDLIRINPNKPHLMFYDELDYNTRVMAYDVSKISNKVISIENSSPKSIVIRDYKTGKILNKISDLELEGQLYDAIAFSPYEKYFAVNYVGKDNESSGDFSPDSLLILYEIENRKIHKKFFKRIPNEANPYASGGEYGNNSVRKKIDFSKDGKKLAFIYAGQYGTASVQVYNIESGEEIFFFNDYSHRDDYSVFVYFVNKGEEILIDQKLYNIETGQLLFDFTIDQRRAVNTISDDEKYFVNITDNGDNNGNIIIWDIQTRRKVITIPSAGSWYRTGLIFNKNNSILGVMGKEDVAYYSLDFESGSYELISDQSNKYFTMNGTKTGVEVEQNINHTVYPNPSSELIRIKDYSGEFQIINTLGIEVKHGYCSKDLPIDISNLTTGVYLIKLKENTIKLMKR